MALIVRLFMITFGFLAACFVASMVVLFALLFPEMELQTLDIGDGTVNAVARLRIFPGQRVALVPRCSWC